MAKQRQTGDDVSTADGKDLACRNDNAKPLLAMTATSKSLLIMETQTYVEAYVLALDNEA